jgi:hypothetical protein
MNVKSLTNISCPSLPDSSPMAHKEWSAQEGFKKIVSPRDTLKLPPKPEIPNRLGSDTPDFEPSKHPPSFPPQTVYINTPRPALPSEFDPSRVKKSSLPDLFPQQNSTSNEIIVIGQGKVTKSTLISATQRKILGGKLADKIRREKPIICEKTPAGEAEEKCQICFENPPDGVFMHCGHGGLCTSCAFEMVTIKPECHLCREEINQVVQLKYPNHFKDIYQAICITDIVIEHADESVDT